jgi:hypothetical protein
MLARLSSSLGAGGSKNFRYYAGRGFARDAAVVDTLDRVLSLLRNKIPGENP